MGKNAKIENVVILQSKFDLEYRRVFFGQAKLMPDRVVLKGLFYKRVIMLAEVQEVRWSSDLIVLGLYNGDELEMIIQSAALWKYELQARCGLTDSVAPLVEKGGDSVYPNANLNELPIPTLNVRPPSTAQHELDYPENGSKITASSRESSYKVKTAFAQDMPQKD